MSLDTVIEKFCSQPIIQREHSENAVKCVVSERSRSSRCSHANFKESQNTSTQQEFLNSFNDFNNDLTINNTNDLIMRFFTQTPELNIELLWDDQNWLQYIFDGMRLTRATSLLMQYINKWREGFEAEQLEYKKQNAGRYRANSFLRETLLSNHSLS